MSHVINSRALIGEKPCINKAIHALLMHGHATFNMNEHSTWNLRSRDINEKAKQNNERNNAECSKCFQFLCNNSDRTWFFNALTFARSYIGFQHLPRDLANVNA